MYKNNKSDDHVHFDDDINLKDIFLALWTHKWVIVGFVIIGWFIASIYAKSLPDIYESKTYLRATQSEGGMQLGGVSQLAALAGVSLPSSSGSSVTEAVAVLSSYEFFKDGILPKIFLPDLMAVSRYDLDSKEIIYNKGLYNFEENRWVSGISPPSKLPSTQVAHSIFLGRHLSIKRDNATGFLKIAMKHQSPYIAKEWLDTVVKSINESLREDQRKRAQLSIEFLNKQMSNTSYAEIKQGLSQLIQKETEKLMMLEANEDYIFKMIDPPIVSEFTSEPNRSAIETLGLIIGALLGIISAFIWQFIVKSITFNISGFTSRIVIDTKEMFSLFKQKFNLQRPQK